MDNWMHSQELPMEIAKGGSIKLPNEEVDEHLSKKPKTKKIQKEEKPERKNSRPKKK